VHVRVFSQAGLISSKVTTLATVFLRRPDGTI
jgi:hypothetical protein